MCSKLRSRCTRLVMGAASARTPSGCSGRNLNMLQCCLCPSLDDQCRLGPLPSGHGQFLSATDRIKRYNAMVSN